MPRADIKPADSPDAKRSHDSPPEPLLGRHKSQDLGYAYGWDLDTLFDGSKK